MKIYLRIRSIESAYFLIHIKSYVLAKAVMKIFNLNKEKLSSLNS